MAINSARLLRFKLMVGDIVALAYPCAQVVNQSNGDCTGEGFEWPFARQPPGLTGERGNHVSIQVIRSAVHFYIQVT